MELEFFGATAGVTGSCHIWKAHTATDCIGLNYKSKTKIYIHDLTGVTAYRMLPTAGQTQHQCVAMTAQFAVRIDRFRSTRLSG